MATPRKKRQETPYSRGTGVVRLTHEVKGHIISKANWGESIDQTLRRMFKLGEWKNGAEKKRRTGHGR